MYAVLLIGLSDQEKILCPSKGQLQMAYSDVFFRGLVETIKVQAVL